MRIWWSVRARPGRETCRQGLRLARARTGWKCVHASVCPVQYSNCRPTDCRRALPASLSSLRLRFRSNNTTAVTAPTVFTSTFFTAASSEPPSPEQGIAASIAGNLSSPTALYTRLTRLQSPGDALPSEQRIRASLATGLAATNGSDPVPLHTHPRPTDHCARGAVPGSQQHPGPGASCHACDLTPPPGTA